MRPRRIIAAAFVVAASVAAQVLAHAGGLGDDHGDGTDAIFFGKVLDARGAAVAGARVNLTFKTMSFVTTTNAIGDYRIAVPIDPEQSEITCRKEGYQQTGTMRRAPASAEKAPIEVDCMLKKTP
ncbi:MAG TPA: carboxypeptidase regulatory-like domain-containing protein [Pseudolabrys sp.]|jgi:hypothetical protein|nr:carboxypeptidase regulatory-like domain-containing protein [Pseudolabrys sp.]